jgi:hypothetical protein
VPQPCSSNCSVVWALPRGDRSPCRWTVCPIGYAAFTCTPVAPGVTTGVGENAIRIGFVNFEQLMLSLHGEPAWLIFPIGTQVAPPSELRNRLLRARHEHGRAECETKNVATQLAASSGKLSRERRQTCPPKVMAYTASSAEPTATMRLPVGRPSLHWTKLRIESCDR